MTTSTIVPLSWYQRISIRSLFAKSLTDRRIMTLAIGFGIGLMSFAVTAMFSALEASLVELDLGEAFNDFFGGASLGTPAGWLSAETFTIMAPAAVVALALVDAGRSIAAEEEMQLIGLLASNPMSRAKMIVDKSIAIVLHVVVACLLIGLMTWAGVGTFGLDLGASEVWAATLHLTMLGVMFVAASVLVCVIVGKRMRSIVIVSSVAGLSYIVASMLPISADYAQWAKISPWFYYWGNNPLANGVTWGYIAIMAIISALLFSASVYAFSKRDLSG